MKPPRAVFDLTVLLDALLAPGEASAALLRRLVEQRDYELVVSPPILDALERAVTGEPIAGHLVGSPVDHRRWIASLGVVATMVEGRAGAEDGAWASDAIYLAAAREADASLLVTLDSDLLHGARVAGIDVVEPHVLLELLEARRLGATG